MKITPIKPNKISNYQKKEKTNKRQNFYIPKNLNKTSNSNFNSFIKNPFCQMKQIIITQILTPSVNPIQHKAQIN